MKQKDGRLEAWEEERLMAQGWLRIPLATPFEGIEPINVTVLKGDPPALIDVGLRYAGNLERLAAGLARMGLQVEDIGEIWLTHPHIDHFGLVSDIVSRSQAKVYAWEGAVERFVNYPAFWQRDRSTFLEYLARAGVKVEQIERVKRTESHFEEMGGAFEVEEPFEEGRMLVMAGRYRVVPYHLPGHTPWCVAYWFPDLEEAVVGDFLLERITPNPMLYPADASPTDWQGLMVYRASLAKMKEWPSKWVIPGHGASFCEVPRIIERALQQQERRQQRVLERLTQGPQTAYQLALSLFGEVLTHNSLFLVMSEVVRHLEWSIASGSVCEVRGDLWRYERV